MQTRTPPAHIGLAHSALLAAGTLALFVVDRVVKFSAAQAHPSQGALLSFGYVPNSGGVFSVPLPHWLLLTASTVALTCLAVAARGARRKGRLVRLVGLAFMLIGGASNVLDRLQLGSVTDVFTTIGGLSFNLSDLYLVSGLVLLLL